MNTMTLRNPFLLVSGILAALMIAATVLIAGSSAGASSHREAPLISKDPFADNTDTYVFIPQGSTERVVLAANWIPFEGPEGGPNYYEWDDSVLYDIYVDNNGDAVADVRYTLSSSTEILNPLETFLYNIGPIGSIMDATWNRPQNVTITETWAPGTAAEHTNVLVDDQRVAPVNIGSKSTPDYTALQQEATFSYTDSGSGDEVWLYAGQMDDPFWVDLQIFDLLTLRGQAAPVGYSTGNNSPVDSLSGFNVHSLVVELPIDRLTQGDETTLGVWSASRRTSMGVFTGDGEPVQVSRLGMPLVNEVVLPMGLKDTFNSISPDVDLTVYNLLQESVENPEVGTLLCALYGVPLPGDTNADCNTEYTPVDPDTLAGARSGRGDIFDIFLTGMVLANEFTIHTANGDVTLPAGFNVNQPAGVIPAEMIRINTAISGDLCAPEPSSLGVLGGDACGFPNGRRLTDDTVDIAVLAVAGAAYEVLDDRDDSFQFNPALIGVLDDGLYGNDVLFSDSFPYLAPPHSGQSHIHQNPANLVRNGSFEMGETNWEFYTNGQAKFNVAPPGSEGAVSGQIDVMSMGRNTQLYQSDIALRPGSIYRMSFSARSDNGSDVKVALIKHKTPFKHYGLNELFDLSDEWQDYEIEFETNGLREPVGDARLMLRVGPFAHSGEHYEFDNIVIERVGDNS